MAKMRIPRGVVVASIGLAVLVVGAMIFDNSYDKVESVMLDKTVLAQGQVLPGGQSANFTIQWASLFEHSVLVVDANPISSQVKLHVDEPGGSTFEKESDKGYAYHIIGKSTQEQGPYSVVVSNDGSEPATVRVVLGEDPYLSGKCNQSDQFSCYAIPTTGGFVIGGMLALIIGSALAVNDFRKGRRKQTASK